MQPAVSLSHFMSLTAWQPGLIVWKSTTTGSLQRTINKTTYLSRTKLVVALTRHAWKFENCQSSIADSSICAVQVFFSAKWFVWIISTVLGSMLNKHMGYVITCDMWLCKNPLAKLGLMETWPTLSPIQGQRFYITGQVSNFRPIAGTGAMPAPAPETIYDPEVVADACLKSQSLTDRNKSFAGIFFFWIQ